MSARPAGRDAFGLGRGVRATLALLPWLIAFVYGVLVWMPSTHRLGLELVQENQVVELGSFFAFLFASFGGLWLSVRAARRGLGARVVWGFALLGLVFFVMAMEEVSWLQWFFHFRTPAAVSAVNEQHEFNIHNLPVIQELNEWFLVAAGLLGLILSRRSVLGPLGVPRPLGSAFLMVAVVGALEIYTLEWPIPGRPDEVITYEVEVAEMVLGGAALGYMWLNGRRLPVRTGRA